MKVNDLNLDYVGCYVYIDVVGKGLVERVKNFLLQKTIEGELDGVWREGNQWYVSFVLGADRIPVDADDRVTVPYPFVSGVRR